MWKFGKTKSVGLGENNTPFCGGQNNGPQRCLCLSPEHVNKWCHMARGIKVADGIKLLISWPWDGESILDDSGGPSVITRWAQCCLVSERGTRDSEAEWCHVRKAQLAISCFGDGRWPWAKEGRPTNIFIFPSETHFGLLTCRTIRLKKKKCIYYQVFGHLPP